MIMDNKTALDQMPSRIKYYLLDWKDKNMDYFIRVYGESRLRDLTPDQLHELFSYATTKDRVLLCQNSNYIED
jgi:hypothetical protein